MFYEKDGNLYFINNNYYDPILKQYLSMNVVEEMISKATLVGGINPYSINVNSINTSQFTLEPVLDIVYDPAVKSRWSRFWSSLIGQLTACLLTIVALVITIFTQTWALYIASLASALIGLTIGGVISGIQSKSVGKGFWNGFSNYINEEWSQTLGVEMAIYIIIIGVSSLIKTMTDCFIAGTLVLTSIGLIRIEEIKEGDYVYAYNEKTRKKELKKVKQVFRNKTKEWFHLFFKNFENGNVQEIICTSNHRIFIKNKGWTKACEIEENDKVVLFNDKELVVEKMSNQLLNDYEIIYNFEVEDLHNYYVGEEMILVHNDCKSRAFRAAKRSENIPKSSIPDNIYDEKFIIGADGKYYSPKTYVYGDKFIRDDFGGHLFNDGSTLGKHFNAGKIIDGRCVPNKIHFFYGDGL